MKSRSGAFAFAAGLSAGILNVLIGIVALLAIVLFAARFPLGGFFIPIGAVKWQGKPERIVR